MERGGEEGRRQEGEGEGKGMGVRCVSQGWEAES